MTTSDPVEPAGERSEVTASRAEDLTHALAALAKGGQPALARSLERFVAAIATEAERSPRFARALTTALSPEDGEPSEPTRKRSNRRTPGPLDPFTVFAEGGTPGLRDRLQALSLEQLRDIVAEHGMDNDRLAMKWKDPDRVIGRIIERVETRASKGSAFRAP